MTVETIGAPRRGWVLVVGFTAALSTQVFVTSPIFLIPTLHIERDHHLAIAGLLASVPIFGMMVTLIAWGYLVDRVGERIALALGAALTSASAFAAAAAAHWLVAMGALLLLGGMAAASSYSASARLVVGWFPPKRHGLAMGILQTAIPLGAGFGALVIPQLAESHGVSAAMLFPAVCACCAAVCALTVRDPPRPPRAEAAAQCDANPYHSATVLWRIHAAAALLAAPQVVVLTFVLVWLMTDRGWSAASAGALIFATQLLGAGARIAAGRWSDLVKSRLRPVRVIALAAAASMVLLALTDWLDPPLSVAAMIAASVISVSDNALTNTAVAEISGPFWSGRALGTHTIGQLVITGIGPPLFGGLIGAAGYAAAFAVCALFPLIALPLVPVDADPLISASD